MPSERMQRQIERLLDEAEQAVIDRDWELVEARCQAVLGLDPDNADASSYREAAARARSAAEPVGTGDGEDAGQSRAVHEPPLQGAASDQPRVGTHRDAASDRSPLYRRTFVGREAELRQLEAAFDAANAGQGGLVLVVGEPGIGKTSLTEQLSTYASLRGGKTLVGHCYEEGSLSLPYLPFVEAMRTYVLDREPAQLRSELGSAAPEVARIVSEVRDRVQVEPAGAAGNAGEDRYRLLNAVTTFLRNAARVQPLVLVLEDLHDADRGTLDLLQFLARQLAGARLLVAGTYRDVEVDRGHPLSATLAELRRGSNFSRLLLRGLTADEVHRMLAAIAGQDVPWGLAEGVHRQTEGNPLFVQEVMRYLAEEGLIKREGGRWATAGNQPLLQSIPEGLRDVIGRRLARLSPQCNQLLTTAAIIGRDFELRTLQAVAGVQEEELIAALDEALKVAILQDQSRPGLVRYRFAHAFFRQTLYEEVITPRRLRLHQQIARALEAQYAGRLEEHAAELADHFAQSSDPADLRKAVYYARLAARRARAVFAHGEAVRLLEQALAVQEVADPDDKAERCALFLELGEALLSAGELYRAAKEVAEESYGLAETLGDQESMLRACRIGVLGMIAGGAGPAMGTPAAIRWTARLDALAAPGTAERAIADAGRAWVCHAQQRYGEMMSRVAQALATAREADNAEALWIAGMSACLLSGPQAYEAKRLQAVEEFTEREPHGVSPLVYGGTLLSVPVLLFWGRRLQAEAAFRRLGALAERTREGFLRCWMPALEAWLLRIDGRLEESVAKAQQGVQLAEELGLHDVAAILALLAAHRTQALLGRIDEEMLNSPWRNTVVNYLAVLGREDEARTLLWQVLQERGIDDEEPRITTAIAAALLEGAILLGDAEAARRLAPHLDLLAETSMTEFAGPNVARLLGGAAALNGDRERARVYYVQALETAGRIGYRPEIALTRLQMAGLLARGGANEHAEAREHLVFAIAEFDAMGMRPALDQARRLEADVGASGPLSLPTSLSPNPGGKRGTAAGAIGAEILIEGREEHGAHSSRPELGERGPSHPDSASVSTHDPRDRAPRIGGQGAENPAGPAAPVASYGQVFISYSSIDHTPAFALEAWLKAHDIPVWLDRRSIPAGSSWDAEIVRGIRSSAVVAVFVTPRAMASDHVRQELRLAMQYRKPILPLLLEAAAFPEEVEYVLAGRQWVELVGRDEDAWLQDVLAAVRRLRQA